MNEPYASVVVPTHDRSYTLDVTLRSLSAQSVKDIEIIVALDGATDAVRHVAKKAAADDNRIRVLDLPKAPGRGSENRSIAVKSARSDRIFYTDDDDLWFPDHIEKLGPLLDRAEVAYSPVLSIALSGNFHLGVIDYSRPQFKDRLRQGELKVIFDTHLAHRRSTYIRVGDPWARDTDSIVMNLLSALAIPEVQWLRHPVPTALSVHGAARLDCSGPKRREELLKLTNIVSLANRTAIVRSARVEWYLQRCLRDFDTGHLDSMAEFLAALGFDCSAEQDSFRTTPLTRLSALFARSKPQGLVSMTDDQRESAEATWCLHKGKHLDETAVARIIPHLMEPILGGPPLVDPSAPLLLKNLGYEHAIDLTRKISCDSPIASSLCDNLRNRLAFLHQLSVAV